MPSSTATSGPTTRAGTSGPRQSLHRRSREGSGAPGSAALGQYASILLDGIIVQMIVAAPEFDLEAALDHARRSLLLVADEATDEQVTPA